MQYKKHKLQYKAVILVIQYKKGDNYEDSCFMWTFRLWI